MKNYSTSSKSNLGSQLSSFFDDENNKSKLQRQTQFWEKSNKRTEIILEYVKIEGELLILDSKLRLESGFFCLCSSKLIYYNKKGKEQGSINLKHKYYLKYLTLEIKSQKYYGFQISRGSFSIQLVSLDKLKILEWMNHLKVLAIRIDFIDTYQYVNHIGEGNFAEVHKVQNIMDMKFYAAKIFYKDQLTKKIAVQFNNLQQYYFQATIKKEIEILYLLKNNENILQLYEIYEEIDCIILITELLEGDLYNELKIVKQFNENEARLIFVQILEAMKFMRSNNVVHRDLKLDNILIQKKVNGIKQMKVKIADFGLAEIIKKGEVLKTRCGTPGYMAPEVFSSKGYNERADIFSLGILLFTLLNGSPPFKAKELKLLIKKTQFQKIRFKKTIWSNKSIPLITLIKQMTEKNPNQRIIFDKIFQNEWIANISSTQQPYPSSSKSSMLLLPNNNKSQSNILSFKMRIYEVNEENLSKNQELSIENLKTPRDEKEEEFQQLNSVRSFFLKGCDSQSSSRDSLYSNFSQNLLKYNNCPSNEQLIDQDYPSYQHLRQQSQKSIFSPTHREASKSQSKFSMKSPLLGPESPFNQESLQNLYDYMEEEISQLSSTTDTLEFQMNHIKENTKVMKTLQYLKEKY